MEGAAHLEHVRAAGERIAELADGHLKDPVPSMPGYDVGSLLLHTGGFCRWAAEAVRQGKEPDVDWSDVGGDPVAFHRAEHGRLVETLAAREPDEPTWAWGDDQHVRFFHRRASQELAVHRWDVESAVGRASPIDPELAADGIDEILDEFGPKRSEKRPGAAGMFDGSGETIHLHATDVEHGGEWLLTAHPNRFEVVREHAKGDVAAKGTASDLLLFLWGRVTQRPLEVYGDASLLDRWQERVRI